MFFMTDALPKMWPSFTVRDDCQWNYDSDILVGQGRAT